MDKLINPAKGNTWFPGKIAANNNSNGINKIASTQISLAPAKIGQSKPIYNSLPLNLFLIYSDIASDIGDNACINNLETSGNNVKAAAAFIPKINASEIEYLPNQSMYRQ